MKNITTIPETKAEETAPIKATGSLPLDVKKYQHHTEVFDLTEEQRIELLQTIWSIMAAFVDLGFGVDAVQYIFRDNCPISLDSEGDEKAEYATSPRFNHSALGIKEKEDYP